MAFFLNLEEWPVLSQGTEVRRTRNWPIWVPEETPEQMAIEDLADSEAEDSFGLSLLRLLLGPGPGPEPKPKKRAQVLPARALREAFVRQLRKRIVKRRAKDVIRKTTKRFLRSWHDNSVPLPQNCPEKELRQEMPLRQERSLPQDDPKKEPSQERPLRQERFLRLVLRGGGGGGGGEAEDLHEEEEEEEGGEELVEEENEGEEEQGIEDPSPPRKRQVTLTSFWRGAPETAKVSPRIKRRPSESRLAQTRAEVARVR